MRISRSIRGAGPTFATFWSLSAIFRKRRSCGWKQNYRSTQNILEAASAVVANNVRRKGKNLWTSRQGGAKIGYYEAPDGENEALFAADTINRYVRQAGENGETPRAAVLYRTNSQSRLFEEAMRRYRPEVSRGGRVLVLRAGRDQGHDLVLEGHPESG